MNNMIKYSKSNHIAIIRIEQLERNEYIYEPTDTLESILERLYQ